MPQVHSPRIRSTKLLSQTGPLGVQVTDLEVMVIVATHFWRTSFFDLNKNLMKSLPTFVSTRRTIQTFLNTLSKPDEPSRSLLSRVSGVYSRRMAAERSGIGDYSAMEFFGEGFASGYQAMHKPSGGEVAIKMVEASVDSPMTMDSLSGSFSCLSCCGNPSRSCLCHQQCYSSEFLSSIRSGVQKAFKEAWMSPCHHNGPCHLPVGAVDYCLMAVRAVLREPMEFWYQTLCSRGQLMKHEDSQKIGISEF